VRGPLGCAAAVAILAFAACEPDRSPATPLSAVTRTAAEPMASSGDMFFALDVLEIPSPDASAAAEINDAGQVAGHLVAPDGTRDRDYFFDPETGTFVVIERNSTAPIGFGVSLNEFGAVAGTTGCVVATCVFRPYRWTPAGGLVELTTGDVRSVATGMNDANIVVGNSGPDGGPWNAARWLADGSFEEIDLAGIASATDFSGVLDINNAEHMVMFAVVDGRGIPLLWTRAGGTVRLEALEAAIATIAPGAIKSITPFEINEAGDIFGVWLSTDADWRNPFLWTAGGTLHSPGDVGDVVSSGLNDHGDVVFTIVAGTLGDLTYTPWFWSPGSAPVALPGLDPDRTIAADINNHGVIAGSSGDTPVIWRPLSSAAEGLDELEATLDDVLSGGGVEPEGADGLRAKLRQIREHLEAGRVNAARHQLAAFVSQVEAMIADGRLSADDGAALLADAAVLAAMLS
jgi:hypothetical protein